MPVGSVDRPNCPDYITGLKVYLSWRKCERRAATTRAHRLGDGVGRQDYHGGLGNGPASNWRRVARSTSWHELLGLARGGARRDCGHLAFDPNDATAAGKNSRRQRDEGWTAR